MGVSLAYKYRNCILDYQYKDRRITNPSAPSPTNWVILDTYKRKNAYVLKLHYPDCTNFEGIKIVVYPGKFKSLDERDPHFSEEENSPIARFRPTELGWKLACKLADEL